MEPTMEIGVVVIGAAGNRGRSALEMLPKLAAQERTKGINLELVGMAEAREESRADLTSHVTTLFGFSLPVVGTLVEAIPQALRWMANGERQRKLIVYDASPTAHHYLHLMTVLPHSERECIYYFGEKPLFTKEGQVDFVAHNFPGQTFFCEFIETENPAFRAANEFIRSERLQIQRMAFWRASCMGVAIAAGDGRGGVEGGALLDKAPHDLSVSLGLLEPRSVQSWSVHQVRAHLLALHEDAFRLGTRNFLSVARSSLQDISAPARIPEHLPADALLSFDVDFTMPENRVIPASYLASWVGIQNTEPELLLSARLASLGIGTDEWLNSERSLVSQDGQFRYENQEVRLGLIEGMLHNRKVHLVLNLLAKFEGRRFVYLITEDHRREIVFEEQDGRAYHDSKETDLFSVFQRVIEHCAGLRCAEYVSTEASLLVHQIMLHALTKANEQLHFIDQDEAFRASAQAYGKYLAPVEALP
ncbi:MAG TPA: hypothetical protein VGR55_05205 [Candidatus Acidoferrum sp.]|nr:hypothetical protein [Candidatus Acidoferrum sp.]